MPVPGGVSDKFGNRYEGRWTVVQLLRVLAEEAESLWLEPWDESGEAVEFVVTKADGHEFHQVKRQRSGRAAWTIPSLAGEHVLSGAKLHLEDETSAFHFVSSIPTDLASLAERCRIAESLSALESLHSNQTRSALEDLRAAWKPWSKEKVFSALSRFDSATIDEARVLDLARIRVTAMVAGDADTNIEVLAAFALENLTKHITASDIRAHLAERGIALRDWWRDASVLQRLSDQSERVLREADRFLIDATVIPRSAIDEVMTCLTTSPTPSRLVVASNAGEGKSVVVAEVARRAAAEGWEVLPVRVDRLVARPDAASMTARQAGESLDLPGSPVGVLANVAHGRSSLLILDQLDAVSLASGPNGRLFDLVDELIREASSQSRMTVLLACRKYDLDNDPRIAALLTPGTAVVEVTTLGPEQVASVLARHDVVPSALRAGELELLRTPLHLRMFLQSGRDASRLGSRKDLFDAYFTDARRRTSERLGREPHWLPVLDRLCDEIARRQSFVVPVSLFDEWAADVEAMVSEGILVRDGATVGFAHQSYFDVAFARRFARSGEEPIDFVRAAGQPLFHRALVRQVLVHLREDDKARYQRTLRDVLASDDMRFHLKDVALSTLENIDDPSSGEWDLVAELLDGASPAVRGRLSGLLARFPAWFDIAHAHGWFSERLKGKDDALLDRSTWILAGAQRFRPGVVADLFGPFVGRGDGWNRRVAYVVSRADLTLDRGFLDLVLRAIAAGDLDDMPRLAVNENFWGLGYDVVRKRPEWGAVVARALLDRHVGTPASRDSVRSIPGPLDREYFQKMAEGAPLAYLRAFVPWVLDAVEAQERREEVALDQEAWQPDVFSARSFGKPIIASDAILAGVDKALLAQAATDGVGLDEIRDMLLGVSGDTPNFLLLRLATAAPRGYAEEVARLILREPVRLRAGYWGDGHWAPHMFLEAGHPFIETATLDALQNLILGHYPPWERTAAGRRSRGRSQWELLTAIRDPSLSDASRHRLQELRHRFGNDQPPAPRSVEFGAIGSPVPTEAAPLLTDDQWRSAMTAHRGSEPRWERPMARAGSAWELARVLEERATKEPERFALLAVTLPPDTHHAYADAILSALAKTEEPLSLESVVGVCRWADGLVGRPCGRTICDLVASRAEDDLPNEALSLVAWYASNAPDPASRERPVTSDSMDEPELIETHTLNSDRGRAMLAVRQLIAADASRLERLRAPIEAAVQDPVDAVRVAGAEALLPCLGLDEAFVLAMHARLISDCDDAVLATRPVAYLTQVLLQRHLDVTKYVLERMVSSPDPSVGKAAGGLATLMSLLSSDADGLGKRVREGSQQQRLGVVDALRANLEVPSLVGRCVAGLKDFFNDEDPDIRREAAWTFYGHREIALTRPELISTFIASRAFEEHHDALLRAIAGVTAGAHRAGPARLRTIPGRGRSRSRRSPHPQRNQRQMGVSNRCALPRPGGR